MWPSHAGHDYKRVEEHPFTVRVFKKNGGKGASSGGYTVCFDDNGFIFSIQSDFVSYFFH